jgi:polynucleotide 5'-hydroxyl-kinase GRC3/NOL9
MSETILKIPPEWRKAAEDIEVHGGPLMVLGAPGSGKTTFSIYLSAYFCRRGRKVAWIDMDPGQPFVGPPAVQSLALYSDAADIMKRRAPLAMTFVGNTSPVGHLLEAIAGLQKLVSRAKSLDPDLILINTSGLVNGGAARELTFHEIDVISPRYIVALQRTNEVEHLLSPHSHRAGLLFLRLPTPTDAVNASREARTTARERRFKDYFRGAVLQDIALSDVGVHGPGFSTGERLGFRDINRLSKIVQGIVIHAELASDRLFLIVEGDYAGDELYPAKEQYSVREVIVVRRDEMDHLLVGLNDDHNLCLGLGIIREVDVREQAIKVITPVKDIAAIRHISFGSLRVSPAGGELGRW